MVTLVAAPAPPRFADTLLVPDDLLLSRFVVGTFGGGGGGCISATVDVGNVGGS